METPILCVGNQKGGTEKTTTAISVGHGLAMRGNKVLLVDLDPQGHLAHLLHLPKASGLKRWFYDEVSVSDVIVQARPNLFILPGDKSTENVKGKIRDEPYGEQLFASQIAEQTKGFDLVILDLAPSLDVLHVAALMASQVLLVPTRLRFADLDGVLS